MRIKRGASVLSVALSAAHAPWVNASVTLLPIGAKGEAVAESRIGAVRLPVALDDSRLSVAVRTDKPSYKPGEDAEITVEVKDGVKPSARAEIALAVVDEGILRLTNFHEPDPVAALRPGHGLDFHVRDTRRGLAELFERSHIAGDGSGRGGTATLGSTRKNFVETALWRPDLRTDAAGRATVKLRLPDNLTEFRIMAVALDDAGKGAAEESSFTVKKPVMLIPVVPRFASSGDKLEVAAMLHNNGGAPLQATVTMGAQQKGVTVDAGGHTRVGFPIEPSVEGEQALAFTVTDSGGHVLDRVEAKLRTEQPGVEEHPRVAGSFVHSREVKLEVPSDAIGRGVDMVSVVVGQHLWPELGERLDYLLGYPHGCVEQTTSSTLPLIAARTILPRIGVHKLSEAEIDTRIRAGLQRYVTMRTSSGGLAYWPGGTEPNTFGTAYAMRAVVLAQKAGVEPPPGLLEGMAGYLESQILSHSAGPEVRAAIAESLAEIGKLPQGSTDALADAGKDCGVFGQASLAMAFGALGGQDDRVSALVTEIEASFGDDGSLHREPRHDEFYYYGSPTRTKAQAAIALSKLKPGSKLLPLLLSSLASETSSYTTQATAWSLIALAEHLGQNTAEGAAVSASLDGEVLVPSRDLGYGSKEFSIPLSRLRGKTATLKVNAEGKAALGLLVTGRWSRPLSSAGARVASSATSGPSVYRTFTDAKGTPIDLSRVRAGDVVRVAVLARLPHGLSMKRRGYLAITDRLPAGFEPIQPDLATVASVPELDEHHPFARVLRGWDGNKASHVELRDDRVQLYFDSVYGEEVGATYLARATTPGEFTLPPATAELMYEPDSLGYSEAGRVVIR